MTDDIKNAFLEYQDLKITIKEAETKIKELQPLLIANLPENEELETEKGIFRMQPKTKWMYTDKVKEIEQQLESQKATEQAEGLAEEIVTYSLYFNPKK